MRLENEWLEMRCGFKVSAPPLPSSVSEMPRAHAISNSDGQALRNDVSGESGRSSPGGRRKVRAKKEQG